MFFLLWQAHAALASPPAMAVASAHPLATEAGIEILQAGGNAFDAAVAISAALAVVEPYSSGMGGGGFWLLHQAATGRTIMLDGRERAPLAATRDMYLDASGEPVAGLSVDGPLAAGIPGQPAALAHLAERYGKLPLRASLAPAIKLARDGFRADEIYRQMAQWRLAALRRSPAASKQFLSDDQVPAEGALIRQQDLANTLERLARQGRDGFYHGELAALLVKGVRDAGGIWSLQDLAQYRVVERAPTVFDYRGYRISSAALPSSGGILLAQICNMLEAMDWHNREQPQRTHLLIEAMRRAYRDRARYLGDSDHVEVPLERLTSAHYAHGLASGIHPERATPSELLPVTMRATAESHHTSHFSVLDGDGNRVAATLSVNYPFGAGFVAPGTGVLLNDEMDDFSARPGVANLYGLTGTEANAIAPGKRMLSSMSPTFVEGQGKIALLGTPGGSRIITMVLGGILAMLDGQPVEQWVGRPRIHHQYLPDVIEYEAGALTAAQLQALTDMGHDSKQVDRPYGNMQAILWDRAKGVSAASDPRGIGSARTIPLPRSPADHAASDR